MTFKLTHIQRLILSTIIVGLLVAGYIMSISFFVNYPQSGDFYKFYMSGKFFLEGKDIYEEVPFLIQQPRTNLPELTRKTLHPNMNPPFQTLLMLPLSLCSYRTAYWLWSISSLASGIVGISLMVKFLKNGGDNLLLLGSWIILMAYFPAYATIVFGQFSLFVFLSLVIVWIASKRKNDEVTGIVLGIAMSLKIFLGLFLVLFAVWRRWRLLLWAIATLLICNVLGLWIFGINTYLNYYKILKSVTWYGASWNASFMAFFTRIFGGTENQPLWQWPWLAYALSYSLSLILLLWLIRLSWPRSPEKEDHYDLGFSLTIVAMLLISPLGWMYYFPSLLIPLILSWRISRKVAWGLRYRVVLALAWFLSTIPQWLKESPDVNGAPLIFGWGSLYFYALLLFAVILIALSHHFRLESRTAA